MKGALRFALPTRAHKAHTFSSSSNVTSDMEAVKLGESDSEVGGMRLEWVDEYTSIPRKRLCQDIILIRRSKHLSLHK